MSFFHPDNERLETKEAKCSWCNQTVIVVHGAAGKGYWSRCETTWRFCKACLQKMIETIDKANTNG